MISLSSTPEDIAKQVTTCSAVLLPGSKADVDPQKFNTQKHPLTAPADALREAADELLLQDAYNLRKPLFGICYGLQSLNVWRSGTLVQHIESAVNHAPGAKVEYVHPVTVMSGSRLLETSKEDAEREDAKQSEILVNSSHHQSAAVIGDGLRVTARCPVDGVVEAIEGTAPGHYVLAVQWHPERDFERDKFSEHLFGSFIRAAEDWKAPM